MEFIDTHVHCWSEDLPPWLDDPALVSIATPRTIADYRAAAGDGLAGAVYMEVDVAPKDRAKEVAAVVAMCSDPANKLRGAVIGAPVVDGSVEEFAQYLDVHAKSEWVKGCRQVLHAQPVGTCVRDDIVEKARLCGERGLVFELCMRSDDLLSAAKLAAAAPGTRFVLDHCGGHHNIPEGGRDVWQRGIEACAALPNVWCKLSGLLGAQGGTDGAAGAAAWSAAAQAETVQACLRAFGEGRLLFGGDWPVCTLTASLGAWVACVDDLLKECSAERRAKLLKRNAEEVYRLS